MTEILDFPVIGELHVAGLTRKELEAQIQKKLEPAFSNEHPIITIRFTNYDVNILGEVVRPGKYSSKNDRLTIFEGLALAGDLTIYGRRDNVKVLREKADGSKILLFVNLSDKNIVNSPAYYLEQNDVLYVEHQQIKVQIFHHQFRRNINGVCFIHPYFPGQSGSQYSQVITLIDSAYEN